jgi:pyruvate/2-oxoglutarate dehydrogenase complex dihydrolipoamide dehydrogenase (E3) component
MDYDIIIIGGGSAGYSAADTAQNAGAKVAILDPGPLGGLCILRGCMPSKAILRSSEVMALTARTQEFGLAPAATKANLSAIIDRKNRLIGEFADYRIGQLNNPRFDLIQEKGSFNSPHEIQVGSKKLSAKNLIIATGSIISDFPIPGLKEAGFITSDHALELREMPESMIVLGAGPVATELAQFFCRIGVKVSLIQRSGHIFSSGDEDLARPVEAQLREEGMDVYTSTNLNKFTRDGKLTTAHFTHESLEKTVSAQTVLQALGRRANTDGLNLEAAGVELNKGRVKVDLEMRTNQRHIFAVGDVNGLHEVVHTAIWQGEIAAHNAILTDQPAIRFDDHLKTNIAFTDPAVASVGLTEKECKAKNISYLAASYPFDDHGKSMCLGETRGHVKLMCDPKTGKIIGSHIVGPGAAEMIHELIAIMYFNGTVKDLAKIPHYHPTLSEILTYPAEELADQLD